MVDYEPAVAKRKRQLFRNLFDLLPKSGPVVSYHLLAQDFLCFFFGGGRCFDSLVHEMWTFPATCVWSCGNFFGDANHFPKTKQRFFCSYLCVQEPKSISGNRCHDWPYHSPILISFTMQPINTSLWVQRGCWRKWPKNSHVIFVQVLEVGIGSFPNALYMGSQDAPQNMDIIGVDPNASRRSEGCCVVSCSNR